jgi:lysozyme
MLPTGTRGAESTTAWHRRLRISTRPGVASVLTASLLLASLGTSVLAASDAEQASSGRSAQGVAADPTEEPTPEPTPKPTPWPTPPGIKGLDVSHWNGYPDFVDLQGKGMRFVISKASQGTSFVDDTYKRHTREAREAGLLVGAYHFFDYRLGGLAQAKHYLDTVRSSTGLGSLLPLVVDVETLGSLGTPNKAKAKSRLHALIDELYRQTGRYPMIYTSRFMWDKVVGGATGFRQYPLWVACWKCDTVWLPAGWTDWRLWQVGQFKFSGGVKLDGNVYRKDMNKLRLERQRNLNLDGGAEWTATKDVTADLRGFDGSEVRYAVGDGTFGTWKPFSSNFGLQLGGKQGRQEVRLQLRSFRNVKTTVLHEEIRLDSVAPSVSGPSLKLRNGARVEPSGKRVPALSAMSASDATSGLLGSTLRATCGGTQRASKHRPASKLDLSFRLDRDGCTIKGSAEDVVGNSANEQLQPSVALHDIRSGSATFHGSWKTLVNGDALGDTLARSSAKDAHVKLQIDGSQFAVVARKGPAGGRFKVIVDGKHVDTVDLYSKAGDSRRIVYVSNVPRGPHTVRLKATGTAQGDSSGTTVWLDAVLVLDKRW